MTKIDIISGFLGAGKTTLIKELLQDALKGEQVVLIENEFGEIGIDGGFLKDAGIEIREMNSGCICCSLVGDFGTALTEVIEKYHPDRIIIEPSGVGKLSDIIHAVENVKCDTELKLNSYTTVADVSKCKMYLRNFGEFFENQISFARTIVLSRTDKASKEKVQQAVELLRGVNKDAVIITTPIKELGGRKLLETMEGVTIDLMFEEEHEHHHEHDEHCECGCHEHEHHHNHEHHHEHDEHCECGCHDHEHHHEHGHHHHHADEVFTSWGRETARNYQKEEIENILKALSEDTSFGMVLRAKGMVAGGEGNWIYFDMVPQEYEIREGAPEYTGRLCVIGSGLNEEKLAELFQLG